jgi:hypothetical protein
MCLVRTKSCLCVLSVVPRVSGVYALGGLRIQRVAPSATLPKGNKGKPRI